MVRRRPPERRGGGRGARPRLWQECGNARLMRAADELYLDTQFYGIGRAARIAAMRAADELRSREIAAVALFKPDIGGWIVRIYPGGIKRRD